jgi:hypothetical protein
MNFTGIDSQGKAENELYFVKGDLIEGHKQENEWWYGSLKGKEGWFLASFVEEEEEEEEEESTGGGRGGGAIDPHAPSGFGGAQFATSLRRPTPDES